MSLKQGNNFTIIDDSQLSKSLKKFNEKLFLGGEELTDDQTIDDPICDTFFAIFVDYTEDKRSIYQCRKAAHNINQAMDDFKRSDVGGKCEFYSYLTREDYKKQTKGQTYAGCGFNLQDNAWCSMLPGDDFVINAYTKFYKQFLTDNKKCHISSETDCAYILSGFDNSVGLTYFRALNNIAGWFQFTADNDECVAETITAQYWAGRFGDGALYTTATFGILCLSILFYFVW